VASPLSIEMRRKSERVVDTAPLRIKVVMAHRSS
jgi:hypothetical protein